MRQWLVRWLKVQPEEMAAFLWSALLLYLIRTSNILFNNFAETAFLKRFGVEYLPTVYMVNSLVTFFVMGGLAGVLKRLPSTRMLSYLMLFCGLSVAGLRLVVMSGFEFIYPVLFVLKAQYETLLGLVFWNLANDLFNTRQSKRIFPLITSGGVIGAIVGSFLTPALARAIVVDNLMLAYLVTTSLGALVVNHMHSLFPPLPTAERTAKPKGRLPFREEIRKVVPLIRRSTLIKILILLTFLPNLVIPIMNYQFNFVVNAAFKTEGGLITFFGYFRGVLNIVSLVILLFVGKLYDRWGLPVALMFHPCNYLIAFAAYLLRFDVVSAIYARISTVVIRVTINNPARQILMGLFPPEVRPVVRPFLRGTVVRVAILLSSGFLVLTEGWFHPRYLSLAGGVVGLAWLATTLWLKREYAAILLDLVSDKVIDLKSLEERNLGRLFADPRSRRQLVDACLQADSPLCVWYAEMLRSQQVPGFERHLLELIRRHDPDTVARLLPLVPPQAGAEALEVYRQLLPQAPPRLRAALAEAAARLPLEVSGRFLEGLLAEDPDPTVRAHALAGLYARDPERYDRMIQQWLAADDPLLRRAGVIAAGGSGQSAYRIPLRRLLESEDDPELTRQVLMALSRLEDPGLTDTVLELLARDPELVPPAVLQRLEVADERTTRAFIELLGHPSPEVRELAREKLRRAPDLDLKLVIAHLATPRRQVREELYRLLESLEIGVQDMVTFARSHLERAYHYLRGAEAAGRLLVEAPERDLLRRHLRERKAACLDTILRVLVSQDRSGEMRIIRRGLYSPDSRLRSNALEALESVLGRRLAQGMLPLLEGGESEEVFRIGVRRYHLPGRFQDPQELMAFLLGQEDWVTRYLSLALVARGQEVDPAAVPWEELRRSEQRHLRLLAEALQPRLRGQAPREDSDMAEALSLSEKIVQLRNMEIFAELAVNELAAVASLCQSEHFDPGQTIIREGEIGETMYLIVEGRVVVRKGGADGCEVDLAEMGAGDYFGEMALFDDQRRSATVVAQEPTHCLVLHKAEFNEAVREYPQVALQMCRVLSRRLRELHHKIQGMSVCYT